MFCPNCGAKLNGDEEFCFNCGNNLKKEIVKENYVQDNQMQKENKNNNNKTVLIIIGIVSILSVIGLVIYLDLNNKDNEIDVKNEIVEKEENIINNENSINNENVIGDENFNDNKKYDKDGDFLFAIEYIFNITGRGTIVTGTVERGTVKKGDTVELIGLHKKIITTKVDSIELLGKNLDEAHAGENVSILLRDVKYEDVHKEQVLAKPNSIKEVLKFDADIKLLSYKEGGRETPISDGFRASVNIFYDNTTGVFYLNNLEKLNPGDSASITIHLVIGVPLQVGMKFTIKERECIIGYGTVTKIHSNY